MAQLGFRPGDMERISKTVHVGGIQGLGEEIKEQDLADFFSQQGAVVAVGLGVVCGAHHLIASGPTLNARIRPLHPRHPPAGTLTACAKCAGVPVHTRLLPGLHWRPLSRST